jgi:hypothetical protein
MVMSLILALLTICATKLAEGWVMRILLILVICTLSLERKKVKFKEEEKYNQDGD